MKNIGVFNVWGKTDIDNFLKFPSNVSKPAFLHFFSNNLNFTLKKNKKDAAKNRLKIGGENGLWKTILYFVSFLNSSPIPSS